MELWGVYICFRTADTNIHTQLVRMFHNEGEAQALCDYYNGLHRCFDDEGAAPGAFYDVDLVDLETR